MSIHQTDLAIIGAGPVGLFAIFQAGMLQIKCHVIDTLDHIGGQCTALYPEKPIYDIPAHPQINAADLIIQLEMQAQAFAPVYHLGQQVIRMEQFEGGVRLVTSKNTVIEAKALIIAAGCGAFGPNRPLIENIERYEGSSVFYMVQRKDAFAGKKIAIAGGGDSAIDWTLALADIAEKIYLIHRRDKFRCAPESLAQVHSLAKQGKVEMVIPYQLHSLAGNESEIHQVIVADLDGNTKELDAQILLPFFGLSMELGPIMNWGLNLDFHHIKVNHATMQTNIPNIYAIGDIAKYEGKLKLILTGFAEAALACHSLYPQVFPGKALHFEYSTTKGVKES